jgi:hypothetical protein
MRQGHRAARAVGCCDTGRAISQSKSRGTFGGTAMGKPSQTPQYFPPDLHGHQLGSRGLVAAGRESRVEGTNSCGLALACCWRETLNAIACPCRCARGRGEQDEKGAASGSPTRGAGSAGIRSSSRSCPARNRKPETGQTASAVTASPRGSATVARVVNASRRKVATRRIAVQVGSLIATSCSAVADGPFAASIASMICP